MEQRSKMREQGNKGNFGEHGNKAIYFRGTRAQVPPWEGLNITSFICQNTGKLSDLFILCLCSHAKTQDICTFSCLKRYASVWKLPDQ